MLRSTDKLVARCWGSWMVVRASATPPVVSKVYRSTKWLELEHRAAFVGDEAHGTCQHGEALQRLVVPFAVLARMGRQPQSPASLHRLKPGVS